MVLEKDGWLETKGRSSKERDGVGEGGVVREQREKLGGERMVVGDQRQLGGERSSKEREKRKKNLIFFYFI